MARMTNTTINSTSVKPFLFFTFANTLFPPLFCGIFQRPGYVSLFYNRCHTLSTVRRKHSRLCAVGGCVNRDLRLIAIEERLQTLLDGNKKTRCRASGERLNCAGVRTPCTCHRHPRDWQYRCRSFRILCTSK